MTSSAKFSAAALLPIEKGEILRNEELWGYTSNSRLNYLIRREFDTKIGCIYHPYPLFHGHEATNFDKKTEEMQAFLLELE